MKKILLAGILFFVLQEVSAQKVYFIYIQSETGTSFFVKAGDKVASSTASGYLILSKLVDSVYTFNIGKTGQSAADESRFSITINKRDRGFLLKEADGKFGLFDLQALILLQPLASTISPNETIAKRTDAFAVLLAQAANDPSLLEIHTTTVAQTETKRIAPSQAVVITTKEPVEQPAPPQTDNTETVMQKATDVNAEIAKTDKTTPETSKQAEAPNDTAQQATATVDQPVQTTAPEEIKPYKPSVVSRRSESSTSEGFGLVFLDEAEGATDTIRILIPNQNLSVQEDERNNEDSKKFLNITNTDTTKATITVDAANERLRAAKKRRGCNTTADEKDFLKLRKNMVAKKSDEAMISEAQKFFKRSCFSTAQIKSLSSLFLSASGKYHFFDAAYGHVSDQEQYAVLQSELNDDYYVNRFKALVAKQ